MKSSRVFIAAIVAAMSWASLASVAPACSVPVFRYALELWPPDRIPLYLVHRGELDASGQELLDRLATSSKTDEINLRFLPIDLEQELEGEALAIAEGLGDREIDGPMLVLRTPARLGPPSTVLTLELTEENVEELLDSPARKEIGKRLIEDHSVVWVLLEGGDAERDDRAFGVLNTEITRLQDALELPEPSAEDLLSGEAEPLRLLFSSMRIARDDPAERAFVAMLLNVEPDLTDPEFDGEPMVFPIFGRGRALYALVGDGIVPATIEEAARFLTGACQCTVKAENPGSDLLMAVAWERFIIPTIKYDSAPPTLGGLASFAEMDDEPATESRESATEPESELVAEAEPFEPGTIGPAPAEVEAPADRSTTPASSEDGPRVGFSALLIVGVMGIMVLLVGFALTRREG